MGGREKSAWGVPSLLLLLNFSFYVRDQTSSSAGNENERFQGFPGQLGRERLLCWSRQRRWRWLDGEM